MAKSARSAVKKRFRAIKRDSRSAVEAERLARVTQRLAARQKQQAISSDADGPGGLGEAAETAAATEDMELDGQTPASAKKISTSGSRGSARETWKGGKHLHKKRQRSALADRKRRK